LVPGVRRYARAPDPADVVRIPMASPRTLIRLKDTPRPQDALDQAYFEGVIRSRSR